MYHCKDCHEFFQEPNVSPMDWETGYREALCPWCDSDNIEEAYVCPCCGEERSTSISGMCEVCKEELAEELADLAKRFEVTASVLEDMICEHYGY